MFNAILLYDTRNRKVMVLVILMTINLKYNEVVSLKQECNLHFSTRFFTFFFQLFSFSVA